MIYFLFGPDTYRSRQKLKEIYHDEASQVSIPLQEPNRDDLIAEIKADLQSILDILKDTNSNTSKQEITVDIDDEPIAQNGDEKIEEDTSRGVAQSG